MGASPATCSAPYFSPADCPIPGSFGSWECLSPRLHTHLSTRPILYAKLHGPLPGSKAFCRKGKKSNDIPWIESTLLHQPSRPSTNTCSPGEALRAGNSVRELPKGSLPGSYFSLLGSLTRFLSRIYRRKLIICCFFALDPEVCPTPKGYF